MRKIFKIVFIFFLLLTVFSFIEDNKIVCGTWSAKVYTETNMQKTGVDTLHVKRNGRFILKRFSILNLPGILIGRWSIKNDSLVLLAESGGMLLFDAKGRPMAEKLKKKKTIKLSIIIHSRSEMYLALDNYSFARIKAK
jgi:hypothetical protein